MTDILCNIITGNRAEGAIAIPSVCSAQPDVLKASLLRAESLSGSQMQRLIDAQIQVALDLYFFEAISGAAR